MCDLINKRFIFSIFLQFQYENDQVCPKTIKIIAFFSQHKKKPVNNNESSRDYQQFCMVLFSFFFKQKTLHPFYFHMAHILRKTISLGRKQAKHTTQFFFFFNFSVFFQNFTNFSFCPRACRANVSAFIFQAIPTCSKQNEKLFFTTLFDKFQLFKVDTIFLAQFTQVELLSVQRLCISELPNSVVYRVTHRMERTGV